MRHIAKLLSFLLLMIFISLFPAFADNVCRNIFDYSIGTNNALNGYLGVNFQVNNQGLFTLTGTSTGGGGRNSIKTKTFTLPAGTYTVSFSGEKKCELYLVDETTNSNLITNNAGGTFILTTETPLHFGINIPRSGITYNDAYYIQIEKGSPATAYTPYLAICETCDGIVVIENDTPICTPPIKIATTKYNEDAFANLVTTLNSAITKVTNIVDTTVSQANSIGTLATTKQDRPSDGDCPEGRKCLLVTGVDGKPHWYLIQE